MNATVNVGFRKSLEMSDFAFFGKKVDPANYLFEKAQSQWSEESNRIYKIRPLGLLKKGFLKTFLLNGVLELRFCIFQGKIQVLGMRIYM